MPTLFAAAKPTFRSSRTSSTVGYAAAMAAGEPSELELSTTMTRRGGSD